MRQEELDQIVDWEVLAYIAATTKVVLDAIIAK